MPMNCVSSPWWRIRNVRFASARSSSRSANRETHPLALDLALDGRVDRHEAHVAHDRVLLAG